MTVGQAFGVLTEKADVLMKLVVARLATEAVTGPVASNDMHLELEFKHSGRCTNRWNGGRIIMGEVFQTGQRW